MEQRNPEKQNGPEVPPVEKVNQGRRNFLGTLGAMAISPILPTTPIGHKAIETIEGLLTRRQQEVVLKLLTHKEDVQPYVDYIILREEEHMQVENTTEAIETSTFVFLVEQAKILFAANFLEQATDAYHDAINMAENTQSPGVRRLKADNKAILDELSKI
ncbi:MAG: hypothetical protein JWN37_635 [Candidatus Nomurabacteria bacterium]|nr:hypothetical protein [Candidatus Nomurabacteria bacterium]